MVSFIISHALYDTEILQRGTSAPWLPWFLNHGTNHGMILQVGDEILPNYIGIIINHSNLWGGDLIIFRMALNYDCRKFPKNKSRRFPRIPIRKKKREAMDQIDQM